MPGQAGWTPGPAQVLPGLGAGGLAGWRDQQDPRLGPPSHLFVSGSNFQNGGSKIG